MAFDKEPVGYEKTVLSDLQGAWQNLRDTVVEHAAPEEVASCVGEVNELMDETLRALKEGEIN